MENGQVQVSYSVASLLKFLAYVAWGAGLIYIILSVIALDYVDGNARAAQCFFGLLITLPSGGVMYGLSYIIPIFLGIKANQPEADKLEL